jgi:hypothetical protein
MAKITEVVALERGHDGRLVRDAGERFSLDLDDKRFNGATWFAPVDSPAVAEAAAKAKQAQRPNARPLGAGPLPGSNAKDEPVPGAGPLPGSADMV